MLLRWGKRFHFFTYDQHSSGTRKKHGKWEPTNLHWARGRGASYQVLCLPRQNSKTSSSQPWHPHQHTQHTAWTGPKAVQAASRPDPRPGKLAHQHPTTTQPKSQQTNPYPSHEITRSSQKTHPLYPLPTECHAPSIKYITPKECYPKKYASFFL